MTSGATMTGIGLKGLCSLNGLGVRLETQSKSGSGRRPLLCELGNMKVTLASEWTRTLTYLRFMS